MSALLLAPFERHGCWLRRESQQREAPGTRVKHYPALAFWMGRQNIAENSGEHGLFNRSSSFAALAGAEPPSAAAGKPHAVAPACGARAAVSAGRRGTDRLETFQQEAFLSAAETSGDNILETIDRNLPPRFWRSPKPPFSAARAQRSQGAAASAVGSPVPLPPGSPTHSQIIFLKD